jgi:protease I
MTDAALKGLKVAILVTHGFEEVELTEPKKALDAASAEIRIVSPQDKEVKARKLTDWDRTCRSI